MYRSVLIAALTLLCIMTSAQAEERIALVIGNGEYELVTSLDNPVSDANLIASTLQSVGFQVTLLTNSSQSAMKRGIADFGRTLRQAGPDATALFYYAGHGVQSQGNNYLLPVDSSIRDEADLDLVGVEADWVLRQLYSARNKTSIIILDACRNNPFAALADFSNQGLAEMKAPTGSFIAYATAPGDVALDGVSANSPFSEALAAEMLVSGEPIEQMFKQVRINVLEKTGGAQTPWDSSSLTGDFFFKPAEPMNEEKLAEMQLWNSVRLTRDPVQIMLFLRAYPLSSFRTEARELLGKVMEEELKSSAPAVPAAPVVVDTPKPQEPDAREMELIELAQASGALADYRAYVSEFPEGVFADFALSEIAHLESKAAEAAVAEQTASVAATETQAVVEAAPAVGDLITFLEPLINGSQDVAGNSIEKLAQGSPLFAPIEGLPESYWKGQQCSNCHQWTKDALCEQGNFYLGLSAQRSLGKQHPYGGTFKQNLKGWASTGCQ